MNSEIYRNINLIRYKDILIKFLVSIHIIFFISWVGLFFIPTSVWPNRIFYNFWYVLGIILLSFIWGNFIRRYNKNGNLFVCPLTTMTQYLRGYGIKDETNNNHLFLSEILGLLSIKYNKTIMIIGGSLSLLVISYQYFLL